MTPTALIVEDEPEMAHFLLEILEENGFQANIATDGFHAGTILSTERPHLITLDLNMPSMDGITLLNFVRSFQGSNQPYVLVLSGLAEPELRAAMEQGADDYLSKPFEKADFLNKIRKIYPSLAAVSKKPS